MATIRIFEPGSVEWRGPREGQDGDERGLVAVPDSDTGPASCFYHPGTDTEPAMHESRVPPNTKIDAHTHRADEIFYVLGGEMNLGARKLAAGATVFIPGNTLYSFSSGPEGLRFLTFRGRRDTSFLRTEEFMAERAASKGA